MEGELYLTDYEFAELVRDRLSMDAMVARPTLACHCGATKGAGRRTVGYGQSARFHWWVHAKCNKPTAYIIAHWISNMLNGARDILSEIIPSHEEVADHLDRGARFRVRKQHARNEVAELARQR